MANRKKWGLIVSFLLAVSVLFALCYYWGFQSAITKSLILVSLMALFFVDQDPLVIGVTGAFGLILLGLEGLLLYDLRVGRDYLYWAIEWSMFGAIYVFFLLFSIRLRKLKSISELHELVIAGTTAGLWKWKDINKDEQWWSPRYYQLLGYENNEIAPTLTNLGELIHPDDREAAFKVLQDYMAGNRSDLEFEYRIRTKSGAYKWFLGSGEVQFEPGTHKALRVVGSIIDIDQKKQQELEVAQKAALFSLSPNAIIITDLNFTVTSWSDGAERLYQIKSAEAIGRRMTDLVSTTYPYSTEQEVMNQYKEHGSWRGEAHQVTKNGLKVYVLSYVREIYDAKGQPTSVVALNSDLSLLRLNNELNAALKMLEGSTQYLEQLAHLSSNDLKSPITTLQGLLSHLTASKAVVPGHEATLEMIKVIVEQMKSKSVSLDSILQLRKNLTSHDFASEKVSISLVARDVLDMLKTPINTTSAVVNINIEKGLQLRMHHSFLKMILYNLVSNSIKFRHPDRSPVIGISAANIGESIAISVTDNGSGIDLARYQSKLFTIFTRFQDEHDGNGVGLHAVKMIVDFYKGQISVQSKEGEGTTFTIKLPIEPEDN